MLLGCTSGQVEVSRGEVCYSLCVQLTGVGGPPGVGSAPPVCSAAGRRVTISHPADESSTLRKAEQYSAGAWASGDSPGSPPEKVSSHSSQEGLSYSKQTSILMNTVGYL